MTFSLSRCIPISYGAFLCPTVVSCLKVYLGWGYRDRNTAFLQIHCILEESTFLFFLNLWYTMLLYYSLISFWVLNFGSFNSQKADRVKWLTFLDNLFIVATFKFRHPCGIWQSSPTHDIAQETRWLYLNFDMTRRGKCQLSLQGLPEWRIDNTHQILRNNGIPIMGYLPQT